MSLIKIDNGVALLDVETSKKIAEFETLIKQLKEREDALKKAIKEEMEDKGIIKLETDNLLISYVAPTDKETLDTKKLRKENPDVYDDYVKLSPVKSSIRIKVR